ncbi:hypothetical protein Y032_0052g2243 [Ancylostoma ceylanicum]|uniref:Uncharacterized protein n=1 Tax=Ancylostoma ceylanicum TaxID=53326 RepID=A0A016U962_9BILA|nr:hypothetical protein Y032_0052g2243 [Ancylostoma ceylanicum]
MTFRAENLEESAPLNRPVHIIARSLVLALSKFATRASVMIEQTLILHSRRRSVLLDIWSTPANGVLEWASPSTVL